MITAVVKTVCGHDPTYIGPHVAVGHIIPCVQCSHRGRPGETCVTEVICVVPVPPTKPHLRLRYTPAGAPGNRSGVFPWSVEYTRGPSPRARRETYQHATAWGALGSAALVWF